MVRSGRVTVDGHPSRDPGLEVGAARTVAVDGVALTPPPTLAVLHKPAGVQCTVGDPMGRTNLETVAAELLELGLHPAGRLDADTSGLLPFARDGALTQRLLHPRHGVRKVYEAWVEGEPPPELAAVLAAGVRTADGVYTGELQEREGARLVLAVTEGKHRMVRRMLANAGSPVLRLRRLAFGALELGQLEPGAWRAATAEELAWAEDLVATDAKTRKGPR